MNDNTFEVYDMMLFPEKPTFDEIGVKMTLLDPEKFVTDRLCWIQSQEGFVKFTLPTDSMTAAIYIAEFETEELSDKARIAANMVFLKLPTSELEKLYDRVRMTSVDSLLPSLKKEVSEWLSNQPNALYAWIDSGGPGEKEDRYPIRDLRDISCVWLNSWPMIYLGFHTEEEAMLFKLTWL